MYTPVYGNSALHRHSKDTLLPLRQFNHTRDSQGQPTCVQSHQRQPRSSYMCSITPETAKVKLHVFSHTRDSQGQATCVQSHQRRPRSSYMCSITPETAKVKLHVFNHTRDSQGQATFLQSHQRQPRSEVTIATCEFQVSAADSQTVPTVANGVSKTLCCRLILTFTLTSDNLLLYITLLLY